MAFDINGNLYAMTDYPSSQLYSIDTTTGVATLVDATARIDRNG